MGVAVGTTALFLLGAEAWKWGKRVFARSSKAKTRNMNWKETTHSKDMHHFLEPILWLYNF